MSNVKYETPNISVVKIKDGKLHINNDLKDGQFKYIWEENNEYYVSNDGETWQATLTNFSTKIVQ